MLKAERSLIAGSWLLVFDDPGAGKAVLAWYLSQFESLDGVSIYSETDCNFLSIFRGFEAAIIVKDINVSMYDHIMVGTSFPAKVYIRELFLSGQKRKRPFAKTWALVDRNNLVRDRFFYNGRYYLPDQLIFTEIIPSEHMDWFESNGVSIINIENPYLSYLNNLSVERVTEVNSHNITNGPYLVYAPEPISTFNLDNDFGFNELEMLMDLCDLFKLIPDVKLIFMQHKNQAEVNVPIKYRSYFRGISSNEIAGFDSIMLMMNSLGIISFNSSILGEAHALGVPAIRALWRGSDSFNSKVVRFAGDLTTYNLFDRNELIPLVRSLKSGVDCET